MKMIKSLSVKIIVGIVSFAASLLLIPATTVNVMADAYTEWTEVEGATNCLYKFENDADNGGVIVHFRASGEGAVISGDNINNIIAPHWVDDTDTNQYYTTGYTSRYSDGTDAKMITGVVFDDGDYKIKPLNDKCKEFFISKAEDHLESIDLSGLDLTNVRDMQYMFMGCEALKTLVWGDYEILNVNDMDSMFQRCQALEEIDLSQFGNAAGPNLKNMFTNCYNLKTVYLSTKWKYNRYNYAGYYFDYTFYSCNNLVGGIGTTYVQPPYLNYAEYSYIDGMDGKTGFFTLKGSNNLRFDKNGDELVISAVDNGASITGETLKGVFDYFCIDWDKKLTKEVKKVTFDSNGFDKIKIDTCEGLFGGSFCEGSDCWLESIDFSGLDTSEAVSMKEMFCGCNNLQEIVLGDCFDTHSATDMAGMFSGCAKLEKIELSSFNTSAVTNMSQMFHNCPGIKVLDMTSFDTANVERMDGMFSNSETSALETVYVSDGWNIDKYLAFDGGRYYDPLMFEGDVNLVGANGTKCDGNQTAEAKYAHVDYAPDNPGFFIGLFNVSYDLNNGTLCDIPSETVLQNNLVKNVPNDPQYDGYIFGGWFTSSSCKEDEK